MAENATGGVKGPLSEGCGLTLRPTQRSDISVERPTALQSTGAAFLCDSREGGDALSSAAPPQLRVRSIKTLGTADADVLRLEQQSIFNVSNLLEKAKAARERREAAGISDSVEVRQDREAPPFDTRLVGKWLEVCWPYKEEGRTVKIWAAGRVKRVADGLTDKRSPRARKILPAGMLLWAWDADPEYDEPAGERWIAFLPEKWNKPVSYGWRLDPRELGATGPPRTPLIEEEEEEEAPRARR
ncbi:hypothetical protein EMIHUDRAFT_220170 [Emiliania huxleyi CCMP1516]|uniref:Uncharacterized protein n=2 Tax=Emiliania huxleyi TaxID=2903 RepID=A0A0D3I1G1_EMIH1|nr:hypothetical protein EMIHUDRAFT_220170 [Emiliania huxleyi CCMP1516]EOD05096.1 hypothetical protein EMIHUDRAFT_220170 [Emiliania huxleyi CCMP1516]|eukprot:XP_005757525.1 hypothetical protein EMIHUDRAFT_220170 [Emiliania huxleyi CCMP1516]